jgi:GH24 family phage-related lysozyme (muramidase)
MNYNVATGEEVLQAKLDKAIEAGRASAASVIERISTELPDDKIVRTDKLGFVNSGGRLNVISNAGGVDSPLGTIHRNALGQLAARAEMPVAFATTLQGQGDWGRELLADNFNRIFGHLEPQRVLTRAVNGEIRGVLSDSYRRMDSRPIIESFAQSCQAIGAVPVEGVAGDLRLSIRALLPMVFKSTTDVFALGISICTGDFGTGALLVEAYLMRLACLNGMTLNQALRKVHLGTRLDESMQLSQRTYQLDTKTMASAVRDVVQRTLAPARVNAMVDMVSKAGEERVNPATTFKALAKKGMLKKEIEAAEEVYRNGGVEQLPPGDTTWRMSNALSWIAKSAETPERRMELEAIAGDLITQLAA